jgi:hypothetical protein
MQNSLHQHSSTMLVHLLASAQSHVIQVSKRLEEAQEDLIRMQDELADKDRELSRQRRMQMLAATNARSRRSTDEVISRRLGRQYRAQPSMFLSDSDGDPSDLEYDDYLHGVRDLLWRDADSLEDDTVRGDDSSNSDNDSDL